MYPLPEIQLHRLQNPKSGIQTQSLTFRQSVDAQLDLGEVARTQLSTYPVEPDTFAQSDLLDDAVVLAEVPGQPLEGRHLSVSTHLPH